MSNIITSKQLVEMFGSDKNKEYLEKNNRVDTATKKTILKKMSTVMNIVDLGGWKFCSWVKYRSRIYYIQ